MAVRNERVTGELTRDEMRRSGRSARMVYTPPSALSTGLSLGPVTSPQSVAIATEQALDTLVKKLTAEFRRIGRHFDADGLYRDGLVALRSDSPFDLPLDPRNTGWLWDDFAEDNSGIFTFATTGTGAAVTSIATEAGRMGLIELDTGTTTTGYAAAHTDLDSVLPGNGPVRFVSSIKTDSSLSDGTDTYTLYTGLSDTLTGTPTDGVWLDYTHSVGSGVWVFRALSGGVGGSASSTVTVAIDTWYDIEILVNADGSEAVAFINGDAAARLEGGVPTTAGRTLGIMPGNILKSAGTTSRSAYLDYGGFRQDFATTR